MTAVYELSTVKPHLPPRRRYTLAELELYSAGYYQALAMALRVMQLAFRRWESRHMPNNKPYRIDVAPATSKDVAAADPAVDTRTWRVFNVLCVFAVIAAIEVLLLLAALIVRMLR